MIFNIGRICLKIAGRDAGKYCVVTKNIDTSFVEIDGQTRRRKCNINHLEPLDKEVKIKEDASNKEVAEALTKAGFETEERKKSTKKVSERPRKQKTKVTDVMGEKVDDKKETSKPAKKTSKKKEESQTKK